AEYLGLHGLRATPVDGGAAMRRALALEPADLVLLDVRMPEVDGLTLARELRAGHDVGIVMATAVGDVVDRIVGLELGADDYIAKPLDLRELLARIRAVLRRRSRPEAADPPRPATVRFGGHRFDTTHRRLLDPDGQPVRLTRMELDL